MSFSSGLGILALALLLAGCAKAPSETREVDVIDAIVASLGLPSDRLVLMSFPTMCGAAGPPQRVPASLLVKFREANSGEVQPLRLDTLSLDARTLAWEENLHYLEDPELAPLAADNVLLLLSRVGYSEDSRQALVCIEVMVRTNRRSYLVLLNRLREGGWQVTGEFGVEDREFDPRRRIQT